MCPFDEGFDAFLAGFAQNASPYRRKSDNDVSWRDGWRTAKQRYGYMNKTERKKGKTYGRKW